MANIEELEKVCTLLGHSRVGSGVSSSRRRGRGRPPPPTSTRECKVFAKKNYNLFPPEPVVITPTKLQRLPLKKRQHNSPRSGGEGAQGILSGRGESHVFEGPVYFQSLKVSCVKGVSSSKWSEKFQKLGEGRGDLKLSTFADPTLTTEEKETGRGKTPEKSGGPKASKEYNKTQQVLSPDIVSLGHRRSGRVRKPKKLDLDDGGKPKIEKEPESEGKTKRNSVKSEGNNKRVAAASIADLPVSHGETRDLIKVSVGDKRKATVKRKRSPDIEELCTTRPTKKSRLRTSLVKTEPQKIERIDVPRPEVMAELTPNLELSPDTAVIDINSELGESVEELIKVSVTDELFLVSTSPESVGVSTAFLNMMNPPVILADKTNYLEAGMYSNHYKSSNPEDKESLKNNFKTKLLLPHFDYEARRLLLMPSNYDSNVVNNSPTVEGEGIGDGGLNSVGETSTNEDDTILENVAYAVRLPSRPVRNVTRNGLNSKPVAKTKHNKKIEKVAKSKHSTGTDKTKTPGERKGRTRVAKPKSDKVTSNTPKTTSKVATTKTTPKRSLPETVTDPEAASTSTNAAKNTVNKNVDETVVAGVDLNGNKSQVVTLQVAVKSEKAPTQVNVVQSEEANISAAANRDEGSTQRECVTSTSTPSSSTTNKRKKQVKVELISDGSDEDEPAGRDDSTRHNVDRDANEQPSGEAFEAKPLSYEEEARMLTDIYSLDPQRMERVVALIRSFEPELDVPNAEEFEIDITRLQPRTLRELEVFVAVSLKRKLPRLSLAKRSSL